MKFLILGCNGMAGHMISCYLSEQGHEVTGFARTNSPYVKTLIGNAYDQETIENLVTSYDGQIIVNCIGILNANAEANKDKAAYLNGYLPHFLAYLTENTQKRVIHMSTDCVFSGQSGNYTEDHTPDGKTFYDRSKALGELDDHKNLTLRNSIVGPDIKPNGIGLLNWFMQQKGPVKGYTKAMWTGQTTLQLAKTIEAAAAAGATGLYNMVPDQNISKYNLLYLFNKYLRNTEITIEPFDGFVCDKTLIRTNFDFDYKIPDYEVMIKELAEWMKNHGQMYPHYYN